MSRNPDRLILISLLVAVVAGWCVAPLWAATPIARYPLQSDGLDATGINGPMTLLNAPFQDGGIYCNGIYPSLPGGVDVETPLIPALNFDSFAVSVEFKVEEYPDAEVYWRPILIGGVSYRWIGAEIYPDGTLGFLHTNSIRETTSTVVSLDVWHKIVITYDSITHKGALYLDDLPVHSTTFDLVQGDDRDFLAINPSSGRAFKGVLRELVVYDTSYDPTPAGETTWGGMKALYR